MFGFLRLKKHGLSDAHQELYRASYCGGCHALRDLGGLPTTLLTSYDQAFLYLVASALDPQAPSVTRKPCCVVPLRRVPVQDLAPRARQAVAALTLTLVRAKLQDDVLDEKGWGRTAALRLIGSRAARAEGILQQDGFPVELVTSLPIRQQAVEASPSPTLDELSTPTADVMRAVFAHVAAVHALPHLRPVLEKLGSAIGRYLYAWDAVSDTDRDRRSGNFNALHAALGPSWNPLQARAWLDRELAAFTQALGSLPLRAHEPVALALVSSLRSRLHQALPAPRRAPDPLLPLGLRARHAHERGDCDCGDCGGCDSCDCSSCDCGGCENCCDCGDACQGCNCCGGPCRCPDLICCCNSGGGQRPAPPPPPPPPPPGPNDPQGPSGARYPHSGPSAPEDQPPYPH